MWPEMPILSWVMSELLSHQIRQMPQPSIIRRKKGVCNQAQAGAGGSHPPPVTTTPAQMPPCPPQLTRMAFPLSGCRKGAKSTRLAHRQVSLACWCKLETGICQIAVPLRGVAVEDRNGEKGSQESEFGAGTQ